MDPFVINATPDQMAAIRTKLNVPAPQVFGTVANADVKLGWQIVPQGVQVAVLEAYSFKAKMALKLNPGVIEAQVRQQFAA